MVKCAKCGINRPIARSLKSGRHICIQKFLKDPLGGVLMLRELKEGGVFFFFFFFFGKALIRGKGRQDWKEAMLFHHNIDFE